MNLFLPTLCLVNVLGLIVLAYALRTAPDGFEDLEGFHTGEQPADPALQLQLHRALSGV